MQEGLEDEAAVGAAEDGFAGAFGVGHQTEDVTAFVADAGNVVDGAVGVVHVADDDAVVALELFEDGRLGEVAAFTMGDGDAEDLALGAGVGKGSVRGLDAEFDPVADELETFVADQRARDEVRFAEDLEEIGRAHV